MISKRAMWALLPVMAACSSTPGPVDEPLRADPPITTADPAAAKGNVDLDRGVALIKAGKLAEAIPHLEKALAADAKSAEAAFSLAAATEQTGGDKAKVEQLYKQALAFDPKLIDAAGNLAALYLDEPSRPDEAIAVLQKALRYAKVTPPAHQPRLAYSLKKAATRRRRPTSRRSPKRVPELSAAQPRRFRISLGTGPLREQEARGCCAAPAQSGRGDERRCPRSRHHRENVGAPAKLRRLCAVA